MIKPAIIAVGYNRPKAMQRLLSSICNADYPVDGITLIVSIDECTESDSVECVAHDAVWKYGDKIIRRFPERQGLRKHILLCGDLSEQYDAVIVLEDDLLVSPSFYHYAYQALNFYANYEKIVGISLYSHAWNGYAGLPFSPERNQYDVYLGQYCITWGQCWTKKRWSGFKEWYKVHEDQLPSENTMMPESILSWDQHSWGKYFISYVVESDLYYVIPYCSMSTNFSESGQHISTSNPVYQVPLLEGVKEEYLFPKPEQAVKYDVFFERILDGMIVSGIPGKEICVNLNGLKKGSLGREYILSMQKTPEKPIASFGMQMRPIDANVFYNIEGEGIYLYKYDEALHSGKRAGLLNRIKYETSGYLSKMIIKAVVASKFDKVFKRIKRFGCDD